MAFVLLPLDSQTLDSDLSMSPALAPLIVALLNLVAAVVVWELLIAESRARRRLAFIVATGSISTLLFLGAVWPSAFTVLAIGVLPAAVGDLVGVFFPEAVRSRWFRIYTVSAVFLAAVSYTVLSTNWFFNGVGWGTT